jgi:hypothetical protein
MQSSATLEPILSDPVKCVLNLANNLLLGAKLWLDLDLTYFVWNNYLMNKYYSAFVM